MNAKSHGNILCAQLLRDRSNRILCASHCHTVSWDDHDLLRLGEVVGCTINVALDVFTYLLFTVFLWGCYVHASKDHVSNIAVHGVAHDLGKDSSTHTNGRTNDGQEWGIKQESLGHQGPARIRIEDCDADRHVSATNTV